MICKILTLILVKVEISVYINLLNPAFVASQYASERSLEKQQYSVVVATNAPLGLRLNEKLEVLGFVADSEGRGRAVEASGLAEIGDRLIAVNDISLEGYGLQRAVKELQAAQLPRSLRFQTHNDRYIQFPLTESVVDAESAKTITYDPIEKETFDYVISSVGDKTNELKLYAVLSKDGLPPNCAFRELILSQPSDACAPLSIDVTDKYVLVPSVTGCPMHQKAALVEEAGAKGVIFVQRLGEKPTRVRIPPPSSLPHPIDIPIVMVSADSGARLLDQMGAVRPGESQQIRFVFTSACAVDRFEVHPGDSDSLRRSAAYLIKDASAGFMSVSVATSAELVTDTFEYLKPADYSSASSAGVNIPVGRHNLIFPNPKVFDPCKDNPTRPSSRSSQGKIRNSFLLLQIRDPRSSRECTFMRQLEYYQAWRPSGIVLGDQHFPHAAHALTTAVVIQQIAVPVVFISIHAFQKIRQRSQELKAAVTNKSRENIRIHVEFSGENAIAHQWKELANLAVLSNWPATETARDRLFHRMLKDQASLADHDLQLSLVKNERYEALVASYWRAQHYYSARADDAANLDLQEENGPRNKW
ncbi:Protease-associated domain, PA [Plasmopara halstedii]|uniref:Protease-associated domain, PA n=1 Tax=Plasmopara halstedii TaxID=4781 RepID=A0A0N7L5E3_PLAHL|nr:Protease-associated domain, PA [Plasmopara halstedii]CEG41235.1 Protease-associated domain, PA [Plasmopara halstedii]|eukprot:XP_024577604.1 Protease-associated domain, PA [Plasmopara halstedii]